MVRRGLMLLMALLAGTALAAAEQAQPDWSIDTMVAKGAASPEERDTFVKSFVEACLAQNAKVPASRVSKDELAAYCQCTAGKSTSVFTSSDISYMVANNQALPAAATEKLKAMARDCGDYLIERRAGQ